MNAGVLANFEKEIELLREKRVIVVQIETEEWEGFDGRAAAGNDLGATVGYQVQSCKLLEDPDRIGCAKNRHSAGQANFLSSRSSRGENNQIKSRSKKAALRPFRCSLLDRISRYSFGTTEREKGWFADP
jgi:hypothetical protein